MDQTVAWLDQHHISLATVLATIALVVGAAIVILLVNRTLHHWLKQIEARFHLGQVVEIVPENLKGRVIDRNLMFTALREENGSVIQIPNNLFFQKMFRVVGAEQSAFELLERKETVSAGAAGINRETIAAAEQANERS